MLISLPILIGQLKSDEEVIYGGLFFNPIDGYSYFAKMQQGYAGEWTFQLPYSGQENEEVFLFTFYIVLGHITRILGLSIPLVFHLFRIGIAILFFLSLEPLLKNFFRQENIFYKGAYVTLLFGGGLGWIYFLTGDLPIDFWVSEAFVFLSAIANPHFILTFLIMSWLLNSIFDNHFGSKAIVINIVLGIILVNISPFAALVIGFVQVIYILLDRGNIKGKIGNLFAYGLPVVIFALYQYYSIQHDPILKLWDEQNVTSTPGILNLIFGFSPMLVGVIILLFIHYKKGTKIPTKVTLLIIWLLFSFLMSYFPFNLQRRFLVGIFLPLSIVFWYLLNIYVANGKNNKKNFVPSLIISISLFSNLLILFGSVNALRNQDPIFFIEKNLVDTVDWMNNNIQQDSVVLTTVDSGLIVPALGNFRVVYGHPFESINAEVAEEFVNKFWSNKMMVEETDAFFKANNVDYILCEFDTTIQNCPEITNNFEIIFKSDDMALFQVAD